MSINWMAFPEYDRTLLQLEQEGVSHTVMVTTMREIYGLALTKDQVRGRLRRLKEGTLSRADVPDLSVQQQFDLAVSAERQKAANAAFQREMTAAIRAQARWDEFMEIVRDGISLMPPFTAPEPFVLSGAAGTPEEMVVHVTDPHVGKLADPAVIGEGFGYSSAIFDQRRQTLENRIVRLFQLHSQTSPIERLTIYFTGDGVDGVDMRRGHPHRVDIQTATGQVLVLVETMTELTARLIATLGVPVHWEWRYGNHGRVGEFGVNLPSDNWDFMAGKMLETTLASIPGASISVPTTKAALTKLGPLTVLSAHGDGGRKGGGGYFGIPLGAIAANYVAEVGLHQQLIDLYILGHWHQTFDSPLPLGGRVLMSSAWDGGDDYSVNQIKAASQPEQWAFGIHPTRGITWQYRIQLAPRRRPTEVR